MLVDPALGPRLSRLAARSRPRGQGLARTARGPVGRPARVARARATASARSSRGRRAPRSTATAARTKSTRRWWPTRHAGGIGRAHPRRARHRACPDPPRRLSVAARDQPRRARGADRRRRTGLIMRRSRASCTRSGSAIGVALLLDCHSMPPPPPASVDRHRRPCYGAARPWLSHEAIALVARHRLRARAQRSLRRRPYRRPPRPAGPRRSRAADRDRPTLYLDEELREPGPGFDSRRPLDRGLAVGLGGALLDRRPRRRPNKLRRRPRPVRARRFARAPCPARPAWRTRRASGSARRGARR